MTLASLYGMSSSHLPTQSTVCFHANMSDGSSNDSDEDLETPSVLTGGSSAGGYFGHASSSCGSPTVTRPYISKSDNDMVSQAVKANGLVSPSIHISSSPRSYSQESPRSIERITSAIPEDTSTPVSLNGNFVINGGDIDGFVGTEARQTHNASSIYNNDADSTSIPLPESTSSTSSTSSSSSSSSYNTSRTRTKPVNLDLGSLDKPDFTNLSFNFANSSNMNGLRTPISARSAHFPLIGTSQSDSMSSYSAPDASSTSNSLQVDSSSHSRYRSPSLPVNALIPALEVPQSVKGLDANLLNQLLSTEAAHILLVDVRPFAQYSAKRLRSSINICVPSTLLKRKTYGVERFNECMIPEQREALANLGQYTCIVLYDQATKDVATTNANPLYHTLLKFSKTDKLSGCLYYLKGGFDELSENHADLIDEAPLSFDSVLAINQSPNGRSTSDTNVNSSLASHWRTLSLDKPLKIPNTLESGSGAPVLSGFSLPASCTENGPVEAFHSNIRTILESFDFTSGHDDFIPVKIPDDLTFDSIKDSQTLPDWLKSAIDPKTGPKKVAEEFYNIELTEKRRLQSVFSRERAFTKDENRVVDSPSDTQFSISAGVELGGKNRYNNIWPFDHNRVHLDDPFLKDDYINASYVTVKGSPERYIATQGPLPGTYRDFWKVVWDEKVPVIMMITAESEGGQIKCHPYWHQDTYGEFHVNVVATKDEVLTSFGSRSSGNSVTIRTIALSKDGCPNSHTIFQIQYSSWPDLGTPASPLDLLALSRLKKHYIEETARLAGKNGNNNEHPFTIVHCSAGCGRTGTFCTIDSTIDILERHLNDMNSSEDMIYDVVHRLRRQRVSMVQSLRQFVLCYETVLLWFDLKHLDAKKSLPSSS